MAPLRAPLIRVRWFPVSLGHGLNRPFNTEINRQMGVAAARSGKDLGKAGDRLSAASVELSPDGRRVALYQQVNQNFDVWLLELGRGVLSRFTFDPAPDICPIWSPDGSRIVFCSSRKGSFDLFQKPAIGAGTEELLLATAQDKTPTEWSPDGRLLLYRSVDPKTGYDLWALPINGATTVVRLTTTDLFCDFVPTTGSRGTRIPIDRVRLGCL